MERLGYGRHKHFGRLAVFKRDELGAMIDQLVQLGYLKVVGGDYPVMRLSPSGRVALARRSAIPLSLPRQVGKAERNRTQAQRQAGGTLEYTWQLFQSGHTPAQIAVERGLTESTIFGHLADLIAAGRLSLEAIVPADVRAQIEAVLDRTDLILGLSAVKGQLPDSISYGQIRCVMAGRHQGQYASNSRKAPETAKAAGAPAETPRRLDSVEHFLAASRPKTLPGPWLAGLALDFHSRFRGERWSRTEVGELAFRYKYDGDERLVVELARRLVAALHANPAFNRIDGVLPVPPSMTDRKFDPVAALAGAIAAKLGVPALSGQLVKTRATLPQKDMKNLAQKQANVRGAFAVCGPLQGRRLLVLDDLYDSGATMTEVTRIVRAAGAEVCVAVLTKTIHVDS
jgi:hypothetical protein